MLYCWRMQFITKVYEKQNQHIIYLMNQQKKHKEQH